MKIEEIFATVVDPNMSCDIEEWRDIAGFEGYYQVSNYGKVKSLPRQRRGRGEGFRTTPMKVIKPIRVGDYWGVCLCNCGKPVKRYIHRLVAEAFIPKLDGRNEVNHKDGNKHNNFYGNLEWCTHSANNLHAFRIGLHKPAQPTNRKKVSITFLNGREIICESIESAAKMLMVCSSTISRGCSGKIKRVKNCKVSFYEEDKCSNLI